MIANECIEVQTTSENRPSVPAWFAEVVIMGRHLARKGLLEAFAQQVRLGRGRFGSYEPIDFLALLIGYAISGERRLPDFFERVEPFEAAKMRALWTPLSSSSRYVESRAFPMSIVRVWKPSARSSNSRRSRKAGQRKPLAASSIDRGAALWSLTSMRRAKPHGNAPCPAIPPCLWPNADEGAVCAPGNLGRKRGEVVRVRTTSLQMHTRQWIGTFAGKGNGDYRGELACALRA